MDGDGALAISVLRTLDDPLGVVLRGPEPRVVLATPAFGAALGGPAADGRPLAEVLAARAAPETIRELCAALQDAARPTLTLAGHGLALELGPLAGAARHALLRLRPEDEPSGERQAQRVESLGLLVGGVAHDFNNAMMVILGALEILDVELEPGERDGVTETLSEMRSAAEHATALTGQLLAFSRKQAAEPRVFDLVERVDRVQRMLRRLIGEDLQLVTEHELRPLFVELDPAELDQVLINLVLNARDAVGAECREIRVETAGADGLALLTVVDQGHGIQPELRQRIFEPFFTTKPDGQGSGLGLSTVAVILRQAGGSIRVDSEPGRGTRMCVALPLVGAPAASDQAAAPDADAPCAAAFAVRVLVVEDEGHVRRMILSALRMHGFEVLEATGVRSALELCEAGARPELALVDLVMPDGSGVALGEELRARWPDVRLVFMSGYMDAALTEEDARRLDADYLHKPFTPSALVERLRAVLER